MKIDNNSWIELDEVDEQYTLKNMLGPESPDCGWVEQMLPVIETFSNVDDVICDPFAGWGTTLIAASLCRRQSIGIEIEKTRTSLIRQRLMRCPNGNFAEVVCADSQNIPLEDNSMDLCVTSIPYFGPWIDVDWKYNSDQEGQCYRQENYEKYLTIIENAIQSMQRVLKKNRFCICMVENIRVNDKLITLAWDVAARMARYFEMADERLFIYHKDSEITDNMMVTNRAHEYMFIARNVV